MNVLLYFIEPKLDNIKIIILSTQSVHWPALGTGTLFLRAIV